MAATVVRDVTLRRQNAAGKSSSEMANTDDGKKVLIPTDPVTDGRAELAAIENPIRAGQPVVPQPGEVDPKTPMPLELVEQYLPALLIE